MFVSRALDPEFVFHFDVIRQCGGLPATDSDSVFNSRKDGTLTLYLSLFCFSSDSQQRLLAYLPCLLFAVLLFCWRAIRQARHGRRGLPPGGSHTAIRCIYSKRIRSIAIHLRFCILQGLCVVNQSRLRFKFLAVRAICLHFHFQIIFDTDICNYNAQSM